ncbi:hypothetical protein GCM10010398_71110 [Streptomyces fimbriatus]
MDRTDRAEAHGHHVGDAQHVGHRSDALRNGPAEAAQGEFLQQVVAFEVRDGGRVAAAGPDGEDIRSLAFPEHAGKFLLQGVGVSEGDADTNVGILPVEGRDNAVHRGFVGGVGHEGDLRVPPLGRVEEGTTGQQRGCATDRER